MYVSAAKVHTRRLKFVDLVQRNVGERMNVRPERLKSVLRV